MTKKPLIKDGVARRRYEDLLYEHIGRNEVILDDCTLTKKQRAHVKGVTQGFKIALAFMN